jgi:hypothetical protein
MNELHAVYAYSASTQENLYNRRNLTILIESVGLQQVRIARCMWPTNYLGNRFILASNTYISLHRHEDVLSLRLPSLNP